MTATIKTATEYEAEIQALHQKLNATNQELAGANQTNVAVSKTVQILTAQIDQYKSVAAEQQVNIVELKALATVNKSDAEAHTNRLRSEISEMQSHLKAVSNRCDTLQVDSDRKARQVIQAASRTQAVEMFSQEVFRTTLLNIEPATNRQKESNLGNFVKGTRNFTFALGVLNPENVSLSEEKLTVEFEQLLADVKKADEADYEYTPENAIKRINDLYAFLWRISRIEYVYEADRIAASLKD